MFFRFANIFFRFANRLSRFANRLFRFANRLVRFANRLSRFANGRQSLPDTARTSAWRSIRHIQIRIGSDSATLPVA
jgi:hypothetical protein